MGLAIVSSQALAQKTISGAKSATYTAAKLAGIPGTPASYKITYYLPKLATSGTPTAPLFIALDGTWGGVNGAWGGFTKSIVQDMAKRGFVAANVEYQSKGPYSCGCLGSQAMSGYTPQGDALSCSSGADGIYDDSKAVFDISNVNSAISRLIAAAASTAGSGYAKASLTKGVAVSGWSQGTNVGRISQTWLGGNLKASYFIGIGRRISSNGGYAHVPAVPYDVECQDNNRTASPAYTRIPGTKMRAFLGSADTSYMNPATTANAKQMLIEVTDHGSGSSGNYYYTTSKAGWEVVPGAGHSTIDTAGSSAWSRRTNANWMAKMVGSPAIQF